LGRLMVIMVMMVAAYFTRPGKGQTASGMFARIEIGILALGETCSANLRLSGIVTDPPEGCTSYIVRIAMLDLPHLLYQL